MCGRASEPACTVDHEGVSGPERYLRHWHAVATTNARHVQRQNWLVPGKVVKLDPDDSCKEAVVRDAPPARLPHDLVAAHCRRRTLRPRRLVRVEHRAVSLHVYRQAPLYSLDRARLVPVSIFARDAHSIPFPYPRRSATGSRLRSLHALPTPSSAPDTSVTHGRKGGDADADVNSCRMRLSLSVNDHGSTVRIQKVWAQGRGRAAMWTDSATDSWM